MAWSVENLQFVVFHSPSESFDAFQVWLELFKATPDGYQRHPDPNMRSSTATGVHAGFNFQVQVQIGRIDLMILGQAADNSPFPVVKTDAAGAPLLKGLASSLAATTNCLRLAFVSILFENCGSLPEANKRFSALANQNGIPAGASDLVFGLNIRKQYTAEGFVVNRLLRWTSLVKQMMQFQVGAGGLTEQLLPIEQPAVVLNIDVNTVARSTPFKSAIVKSIVSTLFAEYDQLREEGYAALVR
jgi:hypothetical protein